MFKYTFGLDGHFEIDVTYSTYGLDQEALLKLKEKPGKLNGRVYKVALSDSCGREVDAWHERIRMKLAIQNNLVAYNDVVDEEPDLVGEHLDSKAKHRKHRDSERYRKVRQDYAGGWGRFDLRTAKKELRRSSRRRLNAKAVFADKDAIGRHGSYFSDTEKYTVHGWHSLGGKVVIDG